MWTEKKNEILTYFKDHWDFDKFPVQFQNQKNILRGGKKSPLNYNDNKTNSYVRLQIDPVLETKLDVSPTNNTRMLAYMVIVACAQKDESDLFFDQVYDHFRSLFLNQTISGARFTNLSGQPGNYEDTFATHTFTLDMTFENIQ